ncbi:hypothetical protein FH972_015235 [Carpinus fangiana]|uniref:Secreted protein n=1 Tax=Carpinus fangiana TaxID=176857 RepID=A0A5N6REW3_9ROSI|nr:hypothetical protein FH972_015235 [Carpinus fangiana]
MIFITALFIRLTFSLLDKVPILLIWLSNLTKAHGEQWMTVPPMAHDASTHLEWKHRRSPPPRRLRFQHHPSGVSVAGSWLLFAGMSIWNCRAVLIVPDPIRTI